MGEPRFDRFAMGSVGGSDGTLVAIHTYPHRSGFGTTRRGAMGCPVGWVINFFYIVPEGTTENRTLSAAWLVWVGFNRSLSWLASDLVYRWNLVANRHLYQGLLQKKQRPSLSHLFAAMILHHTFGNGASSGRQSTERGCDADAPMLGSLP